jgi:CcmD family protein
MTAVYSSLSQYLLAAWVAVWAVFFFYQISLSRRFSQLLEEVRKLKEQLR